jgi:hypothetical protein
MNVPGALLLALTLEVACSAAPTSGAQVAAPAATASPLELAPRMKETGCAARGPLPDPACTPGAAMTTDLDVICRQSTRTRRHVTLAVHREAFAEYGLAYPQPEGAYEVDHLIPLALGGDNTIANLWPEAAAPAPGFHEKDVVEDYLHREVCSGAMDLATAQRAIATDWLEVYRSIAAKHVTTSEDREGD